MLHFLCARTHPHTSETIAHIHHDLRSHPSSCHMATEDQIAIDMPVHGGEDVVQRAAAAVEAAAAAEDAVKRVAAAVESAAAAVQAAAAALHAASPVPDGDGDGDGDRELRAQRRWINESKAQLVLLTTLFATAAIALGIASPMGVWQEDLAGPGGHEAGEPVMIRNHGANYFRYKLASDVSFILSMLLVLMLSKEMFYRTIPRMRALKCIAFVDMCALVFAYTAATNPRYLLRGSIFNYLVAICICLLTYAGFGAFR